MILSLEKFAWQRGRELGGEVRLDSPDEDAELGGAGRIPLGEPPRGSPPADRNFVRHHDSATHQRPRPFLPPRLGWRTRDDPRRVCVSAEREAKKLDVTFTGTPEQMTDLIQTGKEQVGDLFLDYCVKGNQLSRAAWTP